MLQVEYFTLVVQLKLLREKKNIFWQELEDARKERDVSMEQYSAQNTNREYLSFMVGKLKEELRYVVNEKETVELSLAHLLAKKMIHPQKIISELFPSDIDAEYFEEIEIINKESDIKMMTNMIEDVRKRLKEADTNLKDFLLNKEILNKHREVCRQYQLKRQTYDEVVKDELEVAQKMLLIYQQLNHV